MEGGGGKGGGERGREREMGVVKMPPVIHHL